MREISFTVHIIYFLVFSFLGWIIDSLYCRVIEKKQHTVSGYFKHLPLCPMYGVGGVALLLTIHSYSYLSWYYLLIIGTGLISLIEYLGGVFCVTILKERLWDYSNRKLHFQGHIDFLHSFFWLILTGVFIFYLYPRFISLNNYLNRIFRAFEAYDMIVLILFLLAIAVLTIHTRQKRLKALLMQFSL